MSPSKAGRSGSWRHRNSKAAGSSRNEIGKLIDRSRGRCSPKKNRQSATAWAMTNCDKAGKNCCPICGMKPAGGTIPNSGWRMRISASAPRRSRAWLPILGWYHSSSHPAPSALATSSAGAWRLELPCLSPPARWGIDPTVCASEVDELAAPLLPGLTPLASAADTRWDFKDTCHSADIGRPTQL